MNYLDGYVLAVPEANKQSYRDLAERFAKIFKDYGALSVVESWGDEIPEGEVTSFSKAVARKPDEAVVFSWVIWPSKEARDSGMESMMKDPRMQPGELGAMPFDGKRMIFGGFQVMVSA